MKKILWEVKPFRQLSTDQLFNVLQLRVDVFVVEQQCAYPEVDKYDRHAETGHLSSMGSNLWLRVKHANESFSFP